MTINASMCLRALVATATAFVVIMLSYPTRLNRSWVVWSSWIDTNKSSFTEQQSEVYWTLPEGSSSLLPFTNSSIDVYINLKTFREQVRNQKECLGVKKDPYALFRSQPSATTNFTAKMDRSRIELAFQCGGVLYPDFLNALPRETLYPFEAFYLSEPPLWDESTVACHKHSTIGLLGFNKTFSVGDTVALVIKMSDRKGRPRLKGGDRIQVWLKDVNFRHSISTKIIDLNNGTYLARTVLPWVGTVRVKATLRQPREYFRALAYVHRALKSTLRFGGSYNNPKASEAVPCSPFPIVPGFLKSELCNLTSVNGSPWYCGRPSKPELKCSDYKFVMFSRKLIDMPVTAAENRLLKQPVNQHNFLVGNISFQVKATKSRMTRLKDPDVPCNKVPPRSTWHQAVPPGYFYNKVWKSFLCSIPEKVNESCLKNVHMIFYGDSNSREFYYTVRSKIRCKETVYGKDEVYHAPKICENKAYNFSVQHISHASPFQVGWNDRFINSSWLHSPERLLGSIPSTGRYVLSFNHYLHFGAHHLSAYERALASVRDAIVRLLQRNPKVLIILRGPHVAERPPFTYYMGDAWAEYFIAIQRETFRDLQDSVIYFPTWDITVASEDTTIHPACNNHISDVMLQFLCGRDK